jgi:hypothetical protein
VAAEVSGGIEKLLCLLKTASARRLYDLRHLAVSLLRPCSI